MTITVNIKYAFDYDADDVATWGEGDPKDIAREDALSMFDCVEGEPLEVEVLTS